MPDPQPQQAPAGSTNQILMMMMMFAVMFIMFDQGMRNAIGGVAGIVLEPIIGFDGKYPIMTVLLAGLCLVSFSSIVRDYFIDWTESAEKQAKMKDFNKVLKDARMAQNEAKIKRLQEQQMAMSMDQMQSTMDQMKPMMFTMVFLVATFAFIGTFIESIPGAVFSVPWSPNVDMIAQAWSGNQCCGFTNWMLLYMLVSMSFSQIVSRVLKWYKFSKLLKDPEALKSKPEPEEEEDDEEGWDAEDLEGDEDDEYLDISDHDESDDSSGPMEQVPMDGEDGEEEEEPAEDDEEEELIVPKSVEE